MPGVAVTIDWNDVPDRVSELAEKLEDPEPVLEDFGGRLVREWTKSFEKTSAGESSEPGGPPAMQSGQLKNSLTWETRDDELEAGTSVVYGRIQHFGGTIEPRDAEALTVPLTEEARGKRAGDFDDLVFRPASADAEENVIGVLGKTSGEDFSPVFALAEEVTLPERPWMVIQDEDWDYLEKRLREELEE